MKRIFLNGLIIFALSVFIGSCNSRIDDKKTALKPYFPENEKDYYRPDSLTGHFHNPNVERDFEWPEHPSGRIVMKTNNIGLRNDLPTHQKKSPGTTRILITGDSHTDGVLYNSESVASRLEEILKINYPEKNYEILNAGNGYFGPQNYFGTFKKFLSYKPDYFVVIIYTGNDFLDGIRIESENGRLAVPTRNDDYYQDLWKVDKLYSGFTGQYLNQLKLFKSYPQFENKSVEIMEHNLGEINQLCIENNTQMLVVLLPSKIDSEFDSDSLRIHEVFRMMNFREEDIIANRRLTENLKYWLEKENIPEIDLLEPFLQSGKELFWKTDYHVNHLGHEEMARQIFEKVFEKENI